MSGQTVPPEFHVVIEMGNDEMRLASHVADALRDLAQRMEDGMDEGGIRDANGNTVGRWYTA